MHRKTTLGALATAAWLAALAAPALAAPANDDFADAAHVPVPGLYHGNLAGATTELGEDVEEGITDTVWYRIRPEHSSRVTVDTTGSACDAVVGVFTGDRVAHLRRISERDTTVRFQATRGHVYRVRVGCAGGSDGDYTLDISDGSIEGKGVHMAVRPGQTIGSVRRHGLRLDIGARRKVGVSIDLLVSSRTARRLGLRDRRLGHVGGTLGYGQESPATLKLTSAARRALSGRDRLDATLRLTLLDHGPNRVLHVPVHLERVNMGV